MYYIPIQEPPEFANFTARDMEICSTRAPGHRRLWRGPALPSACGPDLLDMLSSPPDFEFGLSPVCVGRMVRGDDASKPLGSPLCAWAGSA